MTAQDEAIRAIRRALGGFEPKRTLLPGILGNGSGIVSGSQPNTSLVRIGNRAAQEVWNMTLPNLEGLPVWVGYAPPDYKRMEVLSFDKSRIFDWGTDGAGGSFPLLPQHGNTHSSDPDAPYFDPVWVQKRMLLPLLVRPTTPPSMSVRVYDDFYPYGSSWKRYGGETTGDLSSFIPASGYGVFVTVSIDGATNSLQYTEGTPFTTTPDPVYDALPTPPRGSIPLCAIAFTWATTAITDDNLFDIRLIYNAVGGTTIPNYDDNEGDPVLLTPEYSALDGTSDYPSRRDHRHNIKIYNSGIMSGVAAYDSRGVSPWAAREDHIHPVPTGVIENYMLSSAVQSAIAAAQPFLTNTAWAAKGDLVAGQSNDLAAILPVGADGEVLTADSGETLGVKWAAPGTVTPSDTDFSGISGLIAHFKSNSGITQSGGRVSDWDGVASTETANDDASPGTGPFYRALGELGWPVLLFTSAGQRLISDVVPPDADNPRTLVAVVDDAISVYLTSLQALICAYGNANTDEGFGLTARSGSVDFFGVSLFDDEYESEFTTHHGPAVIILTYDGTDVNLYWNGISADPLFSGTLTTGTDEPLWIGCQIDLDRFACMKLYELAVFDEALDGTARLDINNQCYTKYGGKVGVAP